MNSIKSRKLFLEKKLKQMKDIVYWKFGKKIMEIGQTFIKRNSLIRRMLMRYSKRIIESTIQEQEWKIYINKEVQKMISSIWEIVDEINQ
jgi:hypothetical protein